MNDHTCPSCKHSGHQFNIEPCRSCRNVYSFTNWEPVSVRSFTNWEPVAPPPAPPAPDSEPDPPTLRSDALVTALAPFRPSAPWRRELWANLRLRPAVSPAQQIIDRAANRAALEARAYDWASTQRRWRGGGGAMRTVFIRTPSRHGKSAGQSVWADTLRANGVTVGECGTLSTSLRSVACADSEPPSHPTAPDIREPGDCVYWEGGGIDG